MVRHLNARLRFQCDIFAAFHQARNKLNVTAFFDREDLMTGRIALVASGAFAFLMLVSAGARAQDVPGIEICTVEKTMERRTSCLQSNVDFLQKTVTKLAADHQQKLDAAKAQIESLKATVASLQKIVDDWQAAQKKAADDLKKKADAPPAKDSSPPVKDGGK
jgi:endonuclease/exonuclease/phosphatase (EEP) superfamily protein YafD